MEHDETAQLIMDALAHAVDGDTDQATAILQRIGDASDEGRMYGVCCAIAAAGAKVLDRLAGPVPDTAMWALGGLSPDASRPARLFALRFLTCYANDDTAICVGLYRAAADTPGDGYAQSVVALLATVAGLARLALAEPAAERLPAPN